MDHKVEQFILFRIRAFADQKAFESLVKEYGPRIDKFLRFRLPRIEDAQDAYADVWSQMWTYAQSTEIESVSGLVHTMARAAVAGFYQKRSRRPEVFAESEDRVVDMGVPVHEQTIAKIDVGLLKDFMDQLKEEETELILLRYVEGYKVKEIAKYLGRTENATSVMLHRSINKLRELIQQKFEDV